jgi:hypothetical protein
VFFAAAAVGVFSLLPRLGGLTQEGRPGRRSQRGGRLGDQKPGAICLSTAGIGDSAYFSIQ